MNALLNDHASVLNLWNCLLPWASRVFHEGFNVAIGPAFLGFLPFLFLPAVRRPVTKYLLAATGLYLLAGFGLSYQPRLLLPAFFLGSTAMGFALEDLRDRNLTKFWNGYILAFGIVSLFILAHLSIGYFNTDRIWFGAQTREEYLSTNLQTSSYYGLARMVGTFCPPGDRLLIVGDARSLYYPRDFYANSVFDDQVLAVLARQEKDSEGIYKKLRQMGIDELVVSGEEGRRLAGEYASYYPLRPGEWKKLDDLIQQRTDLLYLSGAQGIYHLRSTPAGRKKPIPDLLLVLKTANPNP